jgi:hypothetical protein
MTPEPTFIPSSDGPSPPSKQIAPRTVWLCRAPLFVAAALICVITAFNLLRLVSAPAPRDPWEATEVLEAWRSLRGMPVYELSPHGHSTHVYGALVPWLQGEVFRWSGPNNVSGRVVTLLSALATVILLAVTMRGERSSWYLVIALAAILGVNHRSGQYFAENRPDMTSMMFATAGVLLIGFGQEHRRTTFAVLGTACLVGGFFFKQTAFIFAVVPFVALVMRWRKPDRSEILHATIPLAASLAVVLVLKVSSPTIYYYMIDVPKAFGLDARRSARMIWDLLLDSPLFLVVFAECILRDSRSFRDDPRVRWLLAVLVVTIPYSGVTAGKAGGWYNSLLPALLTMIAFCVLRFPRLLKGLNDIGTPLAPRVMMGGFLALLLLMTTFPHMSQENNLLAPQTPLNLHYLSAISATARLPGRVICPEDPTIPFYATGYAGQNIFSERDTHLVNGLWPTAVPETVLAECRTADYVVDVSDYYQDPVQDELLWSLGFEPAPELAPDLSPYHIWRRSESRFSPEREPHRRERDDSGRLPRTARG